MGGGSSGLTCPGVDSKEALGVSAGDPVAEPVAGPGVGIYGLYLDDGHVFGGVLHDRGVVDGLGRLRRVVVDVLHFDVDLDEGGERHHAAVHGVDREPVVRRRLVIQQLLCPDDAWGGAERSEGEETFSCRTRAKSLLLNSRTTSCPGQTGCWVTEACQGGILATASQCCCLHSGGGGGGGFTAKWGLQPSAEQTPELSEACELAEPTTVK